MANGQRPWWQVGGTGGSIPAGPYSGGRKSGRFYQAPSGWDVEPQTYGSDRLLSGGNMQGFVTQPEGSYDDVIGDTDMAAVTSAVIAGGSLLTSYLGQRSANKEARRANEEAEGMARAGLDYNIRSQASNFARQKPYLIGGAQSYAGVMGNVGIKGLPRFNVPQPGSRAFQDPPGSLAELEAGQGRPIKAPATSSGYMREMGSADVRRRPGGGFDETIVEEEEFRPTPRRPVQRRGTMGEMRPNQRT
jgi:hypothetical protein